MVKKAPALDAKIYTMLWPPKSSMMLMGKPETDLTNSASTDTQNEALAELESSTQVAMGDTKAARTDDDSPNPCSSNQFKKLYTFR